MTNAKIQWESNDTFNRGAAVKDGKMIALYRSEDKTGIKIGSRTSRLGYAVSPDGPGFYPQNVNLFSTPQTMIRKSTNGREAVKIPV